MDKLLSTNAHHLMMLQQTIKHIKTCTASGRWADCLLTASYLLLLWIQTRLLSNLRQDHPRRHACSYFRSRKKDSGHAIRSAVGKNPMLHAHFTALYVIDAELLATEFLHCVEADLSWHTGIRCVCTCCGLLSVVTLTQWPYTNLSYCLEIHRMCKYELLCQVFRKLLSDRETGIQTPPKL